MWAMLWELGEQPQAGTTFVSRHKDLRRSHKGKIGNTFCLGG